MQRGSRGGQGLNASPECALSRWHKPSEKESPSPPLTDWHRSRMYTRIKPLSCFFFFNGFTSVSALRVKVPESEVVLFPQVSAADIAQAAEFWTAGTEEQHGKRRRREENLP